MSGNRRIALIAAVSGAAGLTYEIGWSRAFALQLGAEVAVLSGLLAGFLAGLAFGAWVGGRWASASRNPWRLFAGLEAATALSAALVLPGLAWLEPVFQRLYLQHLDDGSSFLLPSVLLACIWMLPATFLMGATFPALVEALRRSGAGVGQGSGWLYGWNTAGGVVGALGAGLVALPFLGLTFTLILAAAGNLLAAGLAIMLEDRAVKPRRRQVTAGSIAKPFSAPGAGVGLLVAVLGAGIASMVDQIGWTRVLSMLLGSTVYGFSLILAAFLSGLAMGGLAGGWLCRRSRPAAATLVLLYLGIGASSLLGVAALGRLPVWLVPPLARAQAGIGWVLALQFAAAFAIVAIPTFLMGAAFPIAVRLRAGSTRAPAVAAGEIYAASSAGLVLGALIAGGWALPRLGVYGALLGAALALPLIAWVAVAACQGPNRKSGLRTALVGMGILGVAGWLLPPWEVELVTSGPFLYAPLYHAGARSEATSISDAIYRRGQVVFQDEGSDATVSVRRSPTGTFSLQINGKTDASTGGDMVSQLLAGHLPALLAPPNTDSALLVGLATGVSLGALEAYPLRHIDTVELLPGVVKAARWFREANGNALADDRVRLIVGDARNHLRYSEAQYDLITSQPTNPWVAGAAALFTREAFLAARSRLRENGVFCQWVQGYGMRPADLKSVIRTFLDVFPGASLWEESPTGGDYFLVARSEGPLLFDLSLLEERLGRSEVRADLERAGVRNVAEFLSHFVAGPAALAALTEDSEIQLDDRTALEFSSALALYENTLPAVIRALRRHRGSPAPWITGLEQHPGARQLLAALRVFRTQARREERFLISSAETDLASVTQPDLAIGIELLRSGLPGPAQPHLERALASVPAAPEARALLGALFASAGKTRKARQHLTEAVRLRPNDIASLLLLVRLEIESEQLQSAARYLSMAPKQYDDDPDLLNLAGALALLEDRTGEAEELLEQALHQDPGLAEAWSNLGVARRREGKLPEALAAYRQALDMDPDNADARFNLAVGLLLTGDRHRAIVELQRVLSADPADSSARWQLAEVYRGDNQREDARHQLEELLRWGPESAEAHAAREQLEASRL